MIRNVHRKREEMLLIEERFVENMKKARGLLSERRYNACAELLSRTQDFVEQVLEAEQHENLIWRTRVCHKINIKSN